MSKLVKGMIGLFAMLLVLSACGEKDAANQTEEGSSKENYEISTDPVTLDLVMSWVSDEEFERYFEEPVRKRYPFITLNRIKDANLDEMVATGNIPDILQSASPIIYIFMNTGMFDNIEPLIEKFNFDLSRLNPVAVDAVKTSTQLDYLTGLPWTMHFSATYYNKDLFDRFGVNNPRDGMTWEEIVTLARTMTRTEDGIKYRGLEVSDIHYVTSVFAHGVVDPKTNKATLNNDTWKRSLTVLKKIYEIPGNEGFGGNSTESFAKHQTLAMLASINLLPIFKSAEGLNWDMAQYPQFSEVPNTGAQVDEWILHVTKQSKHKEQAFQVLATVLSDEVQMNVARHARFPILTGTQIQNEFGKSEAYLEGKNVAAAFKSQPAAALPANEIYSYGLGAIGEAFVKITNEGVDINSALREADESLNNKIAELSHLK